MGSTVGECGLIASSWRLAAGGGHEPSIANPFQDKRLQRSEFDSSESSDRSDMLVDKTVSNAVVSPRYLVPPSPLIGIFSHVCHLEVIR